MQIGAIVLKIWAIVSMVSLDFVTEKPRC